MIKITRKVLVGILTVLLAISCIGNLFLYSQLSHQQENYFESDLLQVYSFLVRASQELSIQNGNINNYDSKLFLPQCTVVYLDVVHKELDKLRFVYFDKYPNSKEKREIGVVIRSLNRLFYFYQSELSELARQWDDQENREYIAQQLNQIELELKSITSVLFPNGESVVTLDINPESVQDLFIESVEIMNPKRKESFKSYLKLFPDSVPIQ